MLKVRLASLYYYYCETPKDYQIKGSRELVEHVWLVFFFLFSFFFGKREWFNSDRREVGFVGDAHLLARRGRSVPNRVGHLGRWHRR
jgi:hypothetical protein